MKKCKRCGGDFPNNAQYHSRSYCLICSPVGTANGYEIRKQNTREKTGNCKTCPICGNKSPWNKNNVCSSCRTAIRRWQNRNRAFDMLGNKCKKCGETDVDILSFHHKDPKKEKKEFELCSGWNRYGWDKIEKELMKCELLCCNCHQKIHARENQKRFKLIEEYMRGRMVKLADTQDKRQSSL